MDRIYLDHAATSPVHPQVVDKMIQVLQGSFGNASSIHSYGREARHLLDESRTVIANSIGASFNEIIFTSGGTEADNFAILGVAEAMKEKGKHIISTSIEHHAVLHTLEYLEEKGYEVTYLQPDETGRISIEDVKASLREDTILVTVMYGNNEVGTVQPIKEIGELLQHHQAYFHTDAVQAYGLVKLDVEDLKVDLLSVSAHKIAGPKGIGFLYMRTGINVKTRLFGGEQELKRRPGTENIASIVGFSEAVKIVQQTIDEKQKQYQTYKKIFIDTLEDEKIDFYVNGSLDYGLPHVLNISFPNTDVESLLVNLDLAGIAASSGSACTAGSIEPSHVLVAMFGRDSERIRNSVRFSFGIANTMEQVEHAAHVVSTIVGRFQGH
ncbi:cysteine desulfurase family protein [Heyndrickxia ginsengihumi]|uniref:cysteine desulfurase n=1 Tax=Heyndrickxia ginsengihumi TaxID=363870 RepID=A0A0A6VGY7_9BACI|nr:cysteine desulfurase family protein [Heyndrickxia ginsengihumi]KHD86836.1 cysteine desulfurase [Heyndrickxia ginsengihumi]MBE6183691.1 cysteine desulfurase [Bacillus sp. (in: firmicutes)]MCM3021832.1 cysteine desulfurase [Heyndrickxia ginsengihumi]NEY19766.1 cysteine desulfurase [Heyndrickxia ginsengihumi]